MNYGLHYNVEHFDLLHKVQLAAKEKQYLVGDIYVDLKTVSYEIPPGM